MKIKINFYFLFFALLPILFIVSCSDDDNPADPVMMDTRLVGNWTLTKVTIPSLMMELTPAEAGFMIHGEIRADGTFEMRTEDSTGTQVDIGQWQTCGCTLTLCYEDDTSLDMEYSVADNVITVTTPIEMVPGTNVEAKLEFLKQ